MTEQSDEIFDLKLVGAGISIDKKVPRRVAMVIVNAVLAADGPQQAFAPPAEVAATPSVDMSPREFLTDSAATTNAEQITAFGYFLCHHRSQETFSSADIRDSFIKAHEAVPKNLSRDMASTVKAGWIHESPGSAGQYYVTNTGMQRVKSKFGRAK
jgi:hypothetical protein